MMTEGKPCVFIVDDDPKIGQTLDWLLKSVGLDTKIFTSGEDFLEAYDGSAGCILLDVRMKGISGLTVQEELANRNTITPIIFMTGHGDIPMAVRAMKRGATDFFTKPFNNQMLLDSIQEALRKSAQDELAETKKEEVVDRFVNLTKREREVMQEIVNGKLNKNIAYDLGIGIGTVETHRANLMKKMRVRTLADLMKLVLKYDLIPVE